jgi:hypothetical protein
MKVIVPLILFAIVAGMVFGLKAEAKQQCIPVGNITEPSLYDRYGNKVWGETWSIEPGSWLVPYGKQKLYVKICNLSNQPSVFTFEGKKYEVNGNSCGTIEFIAQLKPKDDILRLTVYKQQSGFMQSALVLRIERRNREQ